MMASESWSSGIALEHADRARLDEKSEMRREKDIVDMTLSGCNCGTNTIKTIGWASVALGVAAIGVYVGRELRQRYKFKRRTLIDFYSHAGDGQYSADYGVGI
jgi:hypothetical protein